MITTALLTNFELVINAFCRRRPCRTPTARPGDLPVSVVWESLQHGPQGLTPLGPGGVSVRDPQIP
eukprot:7918539-Alexandrium_andersonii.AAC.1